MEQKSITLVEEQPHEVIETAKLAATQLTNIVKARENALVINDKQYLFFEDWQMLGRFYGVSARVTSTEEIIKQNKPVGYLAKAAAVHQGYEISTAEAECTIKEPNWVNKPMFQLRSMAQTRACARSLRQCLGWVAVLAGYEATAAEELIPEEQAGKRLLLQMVNVAKKGNYSKAEILTYAGVGITAGYAERSSVSISDIHCQPS